MTEVVMDDKRYEKIIFASSGQRLSELFDGSCESALVVVCGEVMLDSVPCKVHISSVYDGVDYREKGAMLRIDGEAVLFADAEIENVNIFSVENAATLVFLGDALLGEGILTEGKISLVCGRAPDSDAITRNTRLSSGEWETLYLSDTAGERNARDRITVTLDGARVMSRVFFTHKNIYKNGYATITLNILGGYVRAGIFGTALDKKDAKAARARLRLNIMGADIGTNIRPCLAESGECGYYWSVAVSGGSFARVSELSGKGARRARIEFGDGVDITAEECGEITFKNPLCRGADPWITFFEGYYYYTVTMGGTLRVFKAANLADIPYTVPKTVYVPGPETDFKGLWSPELHYFAASDFGEEHAGWYLYLAGNRKNAEGIALPVMFVMKSLDGKPDGQYGHPITLEPNKYISIDSCADIDYTKIWACGQTIARIGGKVYSLYVSESGRKTPQFIQHINIGELKNPYSFDYPHAIVEPTHSYEAHGHTYSAEQDKWWPKVVEGATAIYGDDGVYIAFSGSGYWTTYYCLSQLRYLGGDPLCAENYKKADEPFLVREKELNDRSVNGCGHASYIRDFDGGRWVCYHAYIGVNTKSGRYAFLEPYGIDAVGNIYVGEGSGHPASLDKEYTVRVNPMPLCYKIADFENFVCDDKYIAPFCCSDEVRLATELDK